MSSVTKKDQAKLKNLKGEKVQEVLGLIAPNVVTAATASLSDAFEAVDNFLSEAEEENEARKKAVVACRIIAEAELHLEELCPPYAEVVHRINKLEREVNQTITIDGGISVPSAKGGTRLRESLMNARAARGYIKNKVLDAVAVSYGYESASQLKSLSKKGVK